jgi:putative phage-type endonuclease
MNETVKCLIDKTYFEQRSKEWLDLRGKMLTASDIATVLGINPYETPEDVMYKKCGFNRFTGNENTIHGNKYEPIARDAYCAKTGEVVHEIGLVPHPDYPWLGGSPDGITESGKLIEIKCPPKRKIDCKIPKYYVPQVQILMEILNLEECDFIDYKHEPLQMVIVNVKRDRQWFKESLPILEDFWRRLQERIKLPLCEIKEDTDGEKNE